MALPVAPGARPAPCRLPAPVAPWHATAQARLAPWPRALARCPASRERPGAHRCGGVLVRLPGIASTRHRALARSGRPVAHGRLRRWRCPSVAIGPTSVSFFTLQAMGGAPVPRRYLPGPAPPGGGDGRQPGDQSRFPAAAGWAWRCGVQAFGGVAVHGRGHPCRQSDGRPTGRAPMTSTAYTSLGVASLRSASPACKTAGEAAPRLNRIIAASDPCWWSNASSNANAPAPDETSADLSALLAAAPCRPGRCASAPVAGKHYIRLRPSPATRAGQDRGRRVLLRYGCRHC